MADGDAGATPTLELLRHRTAYPDASAIFAWSPRALSDAQDALVVVPDTNTLVIPYGTSQKTLSEIGRVYEMLVAQDRLVVPGQVAREFAGARMARLTEMRQELGDKLSTLSSPQIASYPILKGLPEYSAARDLEREVKDSLEKYRKAIKGILEHVDAWGSTDPVMDLYRALFTGSVIVDLDDVDGQKLREERSRRVRNKLPPGYKDQAKGDGGIGDLLIWQTILDVGARRKKDLAFVTSDDKSDWWHRSGGRAVYPRHELVEEYRRASDGCTLYMFSLPRLLDLFNVSRQVVEEVTAAESPLRAPVAGSRAMGVTDGRIVVARDNDTYGAFQVIKQIAHDTGGTIRYRWWYPSEGSSNFAGPMHEGFGEASEGDSDLLEIGPIQLQWSAGWDGFGWVYFGPPGRWGEYDLAVAEIDDVSELDVRTLDFWAYMDGFGVVPL